VSIGKQKCYERSEFLYLLSEHNIWAALFRFVSYQLFCFRCRNANPFVGPGGTTSIDTCAELESIGRNRELGPDACMFVSHFDVECGCSVVRSEEHINCELCRDFVPFYDSRINERYAVNLVRAN
jgi:hypothetical protein